MFVLLRGGAVDDDGALWAAVVTIDAMSVITGALEAG
jgi:hypothetical protein